MTTPNELFSGYLIHSRILRIHFFSLIYSFVFPSSLEILADRLNVCVCVCVYIYTHTIIWSGNRVSIVT